MGDGVPIAVGAAGPASSALGSYHGTPCKDRIGAGRRNGRRAAIDIRSKGGYPLDWRGRRWHGRTLRDVSATKPVVLCWIRQSLGPDGGFCP